MKYLIPSLLLMTSFLFSNNNTLIQIEKNSQGISEAAANVFCEEVKNCQQNGLNPVFILPTGSTPIGMYKNIINTFYQSKLDLSNVIFFNMDEYISLSSSHPDSFYQYMEEHLYSYLSPKLNREKFQYWGLRPLTRKNCASTKLRTSLNHALDTFVDTVISYAEKNPNIIEGYQQAVEDLSSKNKNFNQLKTDYMDDKSLPSIATLKRWIKKDLSLRSKCPKKENLHRFNGTANNLEQEVSQYKTNLEQYLNDPQSKVIVFGGIGVNPPHIAFNDLINEKFFLDSNYSEEEKTSYALNTTCRIVPLSKGTRQINARFFNHSLERVPKKAFTIGIKDILMADRIVIMAYGKTKLNSMYNTFNESPNYKAPSSLLREFRNGKVTFLLDEQAFGIGQQDSLFSLNIHSSDKENIPAKVQFNNTQPNVISFWDIPNHKSPSLLYKGNKKLEQKIKYAHVPQCKKILWVREGKLHYSLWQKLKDNLNSIDIVDHYDLAYLKKEIERVKPDIIFLPYNRLVVSSFDELNTFIVDKFPQRAILGVYYETEEIFNNVYLPITKAELREKADVIKSFHFTQTNRTQFDQIAFEMGKISNTYSSYNEAYVFSKLEKIAGQVTLKPLNGNTYIQKDYCPTGKKAKKECLFSFKPSDSVVIVAPHPDDAEIGAGALIRHLGKLNIPTSVFNATPGHHCTISKNDVLKHPFLPQEIIESAIVEKSNYITSQTLKSKIREYESFEALTKLNSSVAVQSLSMPFYEHPEATISNEDQQTVEHAIKTQLDSHERTIVFLPHPNDAHQTHKSTHKVFKEYICQYYEQHPDSEIIVAYYYTPWTGYWNLYDYSFSQGTKLSALVGSERLYGSGEVSLKPEELGGSRAKRYQLFYFNKNAK